jgi:putative ABC transport system ATP-binding protein
MTTSPLYELRGACKRYGPVTALEDIDLTVASGEFVAIAGPSGSGKTTLLQLLGALDRPSAGRVSFEGTDLGAAGDRALARLRREALGFVFQHFNLIPTLTAQQNIEVALAATERRSAPRRARAAELLERVRLGDRARHLPSRLSGGEQQRVAIARALANRPRVLLADEPTGNLDAATSEDVMGVLRALWSREGLSVVLITHDPAIAAAAPRLLRIANGRLAGTAPALASS